MPPLPGDLQPFGFSTLATRLSSVFHPFLSNTSKTFLDPFSHVKVFSKYTPFDVFQDTYLLHRKEIYSPELNLFRISFSRSCKQPFRACVFEKRNNGSRLSDMAGRPPATSHIFGWHKEGWHMRRWDMVGDQPPRRTQEPEIQQPQGSFFVYGFFTGCHLAHVFSMRDTNILRKITALSTPIFARKAAFCSIFQDLHENAI